MKENLYIGIDFGATNIKGVLLHRDGEVLEERSRETNDTGDRATNEQNWKAAVAELVHDLKPDEVDSLPIGIAAPGLSDPSHRCIAYMPGRMAGLELLDWGKFLNERDVFVINDAKAALLAEHQFGAGRGVENLALYTLGTGVGGAFLVDGELHQGWLNRAGHFGHISLHPYGEAGITNMPGTVEIAIGNYTIQQRSFGHYETTHDLVQAYREGEPLAAWVWLDSLRNFARGICSMINVLSPELILVGGGITKAGDDLFVPLQKFMDIYEWRPGGAATIIRPAQFEHLAGAVGAACFAMRKV